MTTSDVLRLAIALPFGLVFGSFLTVAIYRVPAGDSLVRPRSRCPSCGTPLRNADNIPVVSWLALRGRCHACHARISPIYPLTELACGGLFVAVALVYEDPWRAILLAPFCGLLVAISVIDIRVYRIPNVLVYPAVLVSAAFIVVGDLAGGHLDALARVARVPRLRGGAHGCRADRSPGDGDGRRQARGPHRARPRVDRARPGGRGGRGRDVVRGSGGHRGPSSPAGTGRPGCRTGRSSRPGPCSPSSSGSRSPTPTSVLLGA